MPTSANCPKIPGDARADVGIRAPILPLSQQSLVSIDGLTNPCRLIVFVYSRIAQMTPEDQARQRIDATLPASSRAIHELRPNLNAH